MVTKLHVTGMANGKLQVFTPAPARSGALSLLRGVESSCCRSKITLAFSWCATGLGEDVQLLRLLVLTRVWHKLMSDLAQNKPQSLLPGVFS